MILNSMVSVDNNKNNFYQPKGWLPLDPTFTFVALNQRSPAERKGKAQKRIAQGKAYTTPWVNQEQFHFGYIKLYTLQTHTTFSPFPLFFLISFVSSENIVNFAHEGYFL